MARYWIEPPAIGTNRHKADRQTITFTCTATRNDGARCYVQETHKFHLETRDTAALMRDSKAIGEQLRARMETYLNPMCMCSKTSTLPCPVQHERTET